jgi:hypothetical protein
MLRARHLRRVEHAGRILAARHPQLEQRGEANVDHVQPAHIGGGEEGRGSLAPTVPHARPEPSGDDEVPPAAKRLSAAQLTFRDSPSSAPRTMNRLHAWAMGNIAANAAADAAAAGNQRAPPVEEKTAGDEVEQWFSNDDLLSESDADGNQVEDQGVPCAAAKETGDRGTGQGVVDEYSASASDVASSQDEDEGSW